MRGWVAGYKSYQGPQVADKSQTVWPDMLGILNEIFKLQPPSELGDINSC